MGSRQEKGREPLPDQAGDDPEELARDAPGDLPDALLDAAVGPLEASEPPLAGALLPRGVRPSARQRGLTRRRDAVDLFVAEARRHPRLSEAEERALAARVRAGDVEAARRLVLHNLGLVVAIAYRYRRAWANILDLFQEGSVGLMEAVKRWEPALGSRFGSYAAYWIRAYVLKFLMTNARLIHVGNTRAGRKLFFRLEKERQKILAAGYDPTPRLLAAQLDVDEAELEEVGRHLASREVSTETQMTGDGPTLGENLTAEQMTPEDEAAKAELAASVGRLMKSFEAALSDDRDLAIWREHLAAAEPTPLGVLGERFGISKQRMGQIAGRLKKRFRAELVRELGADIQMAWAGDH